MGEPYPGLIAPASLKRLQPRKRSLPIPPYPGLIAPASLKRFSTYSRDQKCWGALSGAYSPGLIEAGSGALVDITQRAPYPGLIAPASLKLFRRPPAALRLAALIRGL